MKDYASFYTADFKSKGMNLDDWLAHKLILYRLNKNIHIGIKNLKMSHRSTGKLIATFEQHYSSSRINDVGTKVLYFKNIDDSWKICKETWKSKTVK